MKRPPHVKAWLEIDREMRVLIRRTLTDAQLVAWQFELGGVSQRHAAAMLGLTRGAIVDRLERAHLRLQRAGVRQDRYGRFYIEEAA